MTGFHRPRPGDQTPCFAWAGKPSVFTDGVGAQQSLNLSARLSEASTASIEAKRAAGETVAPIPIARSRQRQATEASAAKRSHRKQEEKKSEFARAKSGPKPLSHKPQIVINPRTSPAMSLEQKRSKRIERVEA